ncbi:MAG: type II secretion system protein GspC [Anaeromyxobacteraceae bacterium]
MLDLFFRKYAWTANLVLLFAAAWLLARTVNTIAGIAIRPRPGAEASAARPAQPARVSVPVSLETDRLYKLIGQKPPAVAAAVDAPPPSPRNCDDPLAEPARSSLRLQLVAAVVSDSPRSSMASMTDAGETRAVRVGEEFGGAKLLELVRVRDADENNVKGWKVVAVLCNAGTKEYVELGGGGAELASAGNVGVSPVPPPRPGGGEQLAGVRTVGPNKYEIERKVIDTTLSDLNKIATQARIVPSFKNGQSNGFKLFSIQPGSLYSAIGVENGDVIQRINGYEINSPEKGLELYSKLKESQQVSIELERAGQVIKKEYSITP